MGARQKNPSGYTEGEPGYRKPRHTQAPHIVTEKQRSQVWFMAAVGVPLGRIAQSMEIGLGTLQKHYRRELDLGADEANTNVAKSLYQKAIGGGPDAVPAAIFWLKSRCAWNYRGPAQDVLNSQVPPPIYIEFGGPDGKHTIELQAIQDMREEDAK
jgi:hypothetical protein